MKIRPRLPFLSLFLVSCCVLTAQTLPDYDVRHTPAAEDTPKFGLAQRAAAVDYVRAAFGESEDLRYTLTDDGSPRNLYRRGGILGSAESASGDPVAAARSFLTRHRLLFSMSGGDVDALRLVQQRSVGSASQVRFQQSIGGIPVWGGGIAVTMNRGGDIVQIQSGELVYAQSVDVRTQLTAADAVRVALAAAEIEADGVTESLPGRASWRMYQHPLIGAGPIALQQVVFPMFDHSGRTAYRLFVDGRGEDSYELLVDAQSGALLYRASAVSHMGKARVWPKSPLEGERELRPFGDGWLDAAAQVTRGNNVDAFVDVDRNNMPDQADRTDLVGGRAFSPDQSFDFPAGEVTTGQDPRQFVAAAVSSMFYFANWAHDRFYELGFTEEAGNFQADNFGRGGLGDDPILGAVHNGSSASFLLRPDGMSGRIRTGIDGAGTSDRTDDYDLAYNVLSIHHEYAHGVTSRIIGGPDNVGCLRTRIANGLAEGWSDYFAISFVNDPIYGPYRSVASPERGIRRHSYEGYPFTHQDLGNQGFQVHRDGEIWAATLWDLRNQLGAETTDRLVMDALPLTPCNSSMVEAKDAVLMADELNNGSTNHPTLHEVFARHGLGFSSSSVDGFRLSQSVTFNAAFDLPPGPGENRNPTVSSVVELTTEYLTDMRYRIIADDPDGDQLIYTVVKGPDGLSVDADGIVTWFANQFTPPLAQVEITDGKGGRIIHGFTIPMITNLVAGEAVMISAARSEPGLMSFRAPEGRELLQFQLRGDEDNLRNDADLIVFPPSPPLASSRRFGSNETLTYPDPQAGRWFIQVVTIPGFQDVEAIVQFPEIKEAPLDSLQTGFAGVISSETVYRLSIPEGVQSLTVASGEGEGDVDLYLAKGRIPTCQFGRGFNKPCDFDYESSSFGNTERIVVEEPDPAQPALGRPRPGVIEAGEYFLNLSAATSYSDVSVSVLLDTGAGHPTISAGGIVTAANFEPFVSAGAIGTLFGANLAGQEASAVSTPLPVDLGGVQVRIEGVNAPLYFVSENQINFQIPFELRPASFPSITVIRDGAPGPFDELFVFRNAPEIFLYTTALGQPAPVIVHASDGSLVTPENPARPGEALTAFATGLTEVSNAPATGEASPSSPLATATGSVEIEADNRAAQVLFAGLTPGFVGLAQFNFIMPDLPPGTTSVTVTVSMGFYVSEDVEFPVATP